MLGLDDGDHAVNFDADWIDAAVATMAAADASQAAAVRRTELESARCYAELAQPAEAFNVTGAVLDAWLRALLAIDRVFLAVDGTKTREDSADRHTIVRLRGHMTGIGGLR